MENFNCENTNRKEENKTDFYFSELNANDDEELERKICNQKVIFQEKLSSPTQNQEHDKLQTKLGDIFNYFKTISALRTTN